MSPRALVHSGLRGVSRKALTEDAKETARDLAFVPSLITIYRYTQESDGGGDVTKTWVPDPEPVRGRFKSVRRLPHNQPIGGRVSEASNHIVEMDPDTEVTTRDRLKLDEQMYSILSKEPGSDSAFLQLEVKEI